MSNQALDKLKKSKNPEYTLIKNEDGEVEMLFEDDWTYEEIVYNLRQLNEFCKRHDERLLAEGKKLPWRH